MLRMMEPPLAYGALAQYPYSTSIRDKFSVTSRFGDPIALYSLSDDGKYIFVPRACCPHGANDIRSSGFASKIGSKFKPRDDEQLRVVTESIALLKDDHSHIIQAGTGFGKCHGLGTRILMWGGGVKEVQDIVVGDQLMGPDGTPRKVLSLARGLDHMYMIKPRNGQPFEVNSAHMLSLKVTGGSRLGAKGSVINISLNEYQWRPMKFRHEVKAWRAPATYDAVAPQTVPPYIMGLLLGDGSIYHKVALTTADHEVRDAWVSYVCDVRHGDVRFERKPDANCDTIYSRFPGRSDNPIQTSLKKAGVYGSRAGDKAVPPAYLYVREVDRLELLAGLLDTDGCLIKKTVFEFCSKSKALAKNVQWLSWSLGMQAAMSEKVVKGTLYYRVFTAGHTDRIPTRIARKRADPRQQKKDPSVYGFDVSYTGCGEYYGFTLDGDHLYLLEDCTVTHNTVLASKIIDELGLYTLVVATKDDLVKQWRKRLVEHTDLNEKDIGLIQQDKCQVYGKKIVVASLQSLAIKDRYPVQIRKLFGLVVFDECFPAGTLVNGRRIETIRKGDTVVSFNGARLVRRRVKSVFKKLASQFAKVTMKEGDFVSTPNHPTFVEGVGFVPTALIMGGDNVVRMVPDVDYQPIKKDAGSSEKGATHILLQRSRVGISKNAIQGERTSVGGLQPEACLATHDIVQSDAQHGYKRTSIRIPKGQTVSGYPWGQWQGLDCTAEGVVGCFVRAISDAGIQDWSARSIETGLASLVEHGYCPSKQEALHRVRWAFAQHFEGAGCRCPEGCFLNLTRVDSVEVQERHRAEELGWGVGDGVVYNLEIAGTHTYFASGLLVHNCHRLGAETFSTVASLFPSKLRLGLSAEPRRVDGKEVVFFSHIGRIRVVANQVPMKPKILRYATGWTCPRQRNSGTGEIRRIPHSPGKAAHILKMMIPDPTRNQLITYLAMKAFEAGRRTVIFSNSIDHLERLESILLKAGIPASEIGRYYGAMSGKKLDLAVTKRMIFATPGKMGDGTDVPWIDTCILASPISQVKQIVGRFLREYPNKKKPMIFDLVDDDSPVFKGYARRRLEFYANIGAEVVDMVRHGSVS